MFRVAAILITFSLLAPLSALANDNVFTDPDKFTRWEVVGPEGGDVRVIAVDPRNKDLLYIGTIDGQIHTSNDGGRTWRILVNLNQPRLTLDQLMVDSQDSKIIYASGHRGKAAGGFFRSTDGGVTWKEAKELKNESIHAMTQAIDDPKVIFVGTTNGVWRSKNSGEDWEKIESGTMPINVNSLAVDPKKNTTIYAGTWWRPYKSTDSGQSWRLIKSGMIDDSDVFAITIDQRNEQHIIASACSGIYESLNGGEQWRKIQGIPSTSRRTRAIVQHPSKPGTIYAGTTEGFWMSVNGGRSWAMTTQRNLEINSIAVHPEAPDRIFIATNNYGVMVSNDGGRNFTQSNASFTSRLTYSVTADVSQPNRLYAITQNTASSGGFVFYSPDGGRNWVQAKGIDINRVSPFSIIQDRATPEKLYLGTNLGVFQSLDRGMSWKLMAAPKPPAKRPVRRGAARRNVKPTVASKATTAASPATPEAGPKLVPVISEKVTSLVPTDDEKNGFLAGTDTGLYRSYDLAKGWEKLPFGEGVDHHVTVIHAAAQMPGTIWVGTATSGVIVSRDDGKTWTKVGGAPDAVPISSIAVDPKRPNNIYVGSIHSFYVSRDGGRTWNRRGSGLPLGNYTSILINPNQPDEIFVSSAIESDGGIYFSDDAGEKWKRIDGKEMKVPSRRVWSMAFDPQDPSRIFAGSHSSGVYVIQRIADTASASSESGSGDANK